MIYGSVCSGIESASVAWGPLGWRCAFMSEIEAFPRGVLAHRFPAVPLHGDFTTIREGEYEPIDLLVGGTPCQDFSVAGKRLGLDGARGNLSLEYLRLVDRLRPRWVLWENVPGVLSSNGGRDFGAFLGLLGELGYGFAWRVLDAQYVRVDGFPRAVPQRRNRVFLVGYLGDWRPPAAVLLEPEGLRGDPPPRREAGGQASATASGDPGEDRGRGFGGGNRSGVIEISATLTAHGRRQDFEVETFIAFDPAIAFTCKDYGADAGPVAPTLRAMGHGETHANAGGQVAVAYGLELSNQGSGGNVGWHDDGAPFRTLATGGPPGVASVDFIRRLTPRECERLQGFPDDWTLIPWRRGMAPDGPRYKALGNSKAVNCVRWIGQRIALCDAVLKARAA